MKNRLLDLTQRNPQQALYNINKHIHIVYFSQFSWQMNIIQEHTVYTDKKHTKCFKWCTTKSSSIKELWTLTVQTTFNHSLNSNKNTIFYGSCADYKRGKNYHHIYDFILGSFPWRAVLTTPHRQEAVYFKGIHGVSQTLLLLPLALLHIVCTHHMIIS